MTVTLTTRIYQPGKTRDVEVSQMYGVVMAGPRKPAYPDEKVLRIATRWAYWSDLFGFLRSLTWGQGPGHETGWFWSRVNVNQVKPEQHNWGGLGADNSGAEGGTFGNTDEVDAIDHGILAYMTHLCLYVHGTPDKWPEHTRQYAKYAYRLNAVTRAHTRTEKPDGTLLGFLGTVKTPGDFLNGRWAQTDGKPLGTLDNGYARGIVAKANEIHAMPVDPTITDPKPEEPPVSDAQIPGFKWHPADRNHYQPGRTTKIRGGAQHYTAGTNSLNWLTTTPGTQVSATFLVKHNPTLEDRGWQLVKIEDTAWTTAFANPYTVSIEYEHTGKGPIPDAAYAVLAKTWRDIAAYVERHNLGKITPDASSLKGHKDWVGNPGLICPDGIDIDRIIREWKALITETDALVIAGNPYDAKLVFGFRDMFLRVGAALYPDDPIAGGLTVFGYPMDDEYPTATGSAQVFERVVMQWHRDTPPPFDVVASLRNEPIPEPVEDTA